MQHIFRSQLSLFGSDPRKVEKNQSIWCGYENQSLWCRPNKNGKKDSKLLSSCRISHTFFSCLLLREDRSLSRKKTSQTLRLRIWNLLLSSATLETPVFQRNFGDKQDRNFPSRGIFRSTPSDTLGNRVEIAEEKMLLRDQRVP